MEWAYILISTIALPGVFVRHILSGEVVFVVGVDGLLHVGHTTVAQLDITVVEYLMQLVARWKFLSHELQE